MTVDKAIEIVEKFCENLRTCDIPVYNNEQEALDTLIKAAKEYEVLSGIINVCKD